MSTVDPGNGMKLGNMLTHPSHSLATAGPFSCSRFAMDDKGVKNGQLKDHVNTAEKDNVEQVFNPSWVYNVFIMHSKN